MPGLSLYADESRKEEARRVLTSVMVPGYQTSDGPERFLKDQFRSRAEGFRSENGLNFYHELKNEFGYPEDYSRKVLAGERPFTFRFRNDAGNVLFGFEAFPFGFNGDLPPQQYIETYKKLVGDPPREIDISPEDYAKSVLHMLIAGISAREGDPNQENRWFMEANEERL